MAILTSFIFALDKSIDDLRMQIKILEYQLFYL